MAAELGAEFALFDPDDVLLAACEGRSVRPPTPVAPDPDADYADVRPIDLSLLEPYVVLPDAVPNNGLPIGALRDRIEVQQAFIGSCANGKLEDLRVAARILRGRRVAPGVRLIITPASQKIYLDALREGIIDTLMEAGAVVTNATCGACFGHHMGVLGPGETCITASTRNFKGRMGAASARIFMGSPATVAASAVAGSITDPRGYLA
jgi:3-isopropylmalate/(R)-2-methylmalate dehydratase large subunit